MKRLPVCLMVILPFGLLMAACGPSPEEIATQTAAAWTPTPEPTVTPLPTATATPVPIDLTAKIVDEQGSPIAGASIVFPQSGNGEAVAADDQGQFAWTNLPGTDGALAVSGQGYFNAEQSLSLERGPNEVAVTLTRDPYGVVPAEACAPGEKQLYAEDFQDGKAQGWQNPTAAIEFNANNGWGLGPKEEGNQVLFYTGINEGSDDLKDYTFDNAVWRIKVQMVGNDGFSFLNLRHSQTGAGDTRYPFQWGGKGFMDLTRLSPEAGHFSVNRSSLSTEQNRWYLFEISSYNGLMQVWVDGEMAVEYQDPQPLPAGTIGLEVHIMQDANTIYYFDNLSVCELSAPFVTMATPAP